MNLMLELIDSPSFKEALTKANEQFSSENKTEFGESESIAESSITTESALARKVSSNTMKEFEIERYVFPSLSRFIETLDEQLWKSYQKLHHSSLEYL